MESPHRHRLVAFVGGKGVGKTVCATHLASVHNFKRISVADPLKAIVKTLFRLSDDQVNDGELKETVVASLPLNATPRQLMQVIGTDLFRDAFTQRFPQMTTGFWAMLLDQTLEGTLQYTDVVVDDIRFEDEAAIIRKHHGSLIRIDRHQATSAHREDTHASEHNHQAIVTDYTIFNAYDVQQLFALVDACCFP